MVVLSKALHTVEDTEPRTHREAVRDYKNALKAVKRSHSSDETLGELLLASYYVLKLSPIVHSLSFNRPASNWKPQTVPNAIYFPVVAPLSYMRMKKAERKASRVAQWNGLTYHFSAFDEYKNGFHDPNIAIGTYRKGTMPYTVTDSRYRQ